MNYTLKSSEENTGSHKGLKATIALLASLVEGETKSVAIALGAVLIGSGLGLLGPLMFGHAIDTYIVSRHYDGILSFAALMVLVYLGTSLATYIQTRLMGGVGQRVLFSLRSKIFAKLQELPVAFFNDNKAGDLISRINNDTDKLNQFFSQSLVQFVGNFFAISGTGILMVILQHKLGLVALLPAAGLFVFTRLVTGWVARSNAQSLQSTGSMSAEVSEALNNFKVIVAFNRRDYFRNRFEEVNSLNYTAATRADIANGIFMPTYDFAGNLSQLLVLGYGIYLISAEQLTAGILISFFVYTSRFYDPLRQVASLWSSLQIALAAWDRVSQILSLQSNLTVIPVVGQPRQDAILMTFEHVHFGYTDGQQILNDVCLELIAGKTYALVGPTGGGKTTTASLMARLYDPTSGAISLEGRDLRSYSSEETTNNIGFILQDPFLFTGTVRENIVFGHPTLADASTDQLEQVIKEKSLEKILERFENGLETAISAGGSTLSLGQRQLIAFVRALLRSPKLLILDEATANIDTVTEQLLEEILAKLPTETTKVIIAHRLNTIADADEIFFVNSGEVVRAGSFKEAVSMLMDDVRTS